MEKDELALLDELLEVESGLQCNEIDFIKSLDETWRDKPISFSQAAWLEAIAERVL